MKTPFPLVFPNPVGRRLVRQTQRRTELPWQTPRRRPEAKKGRDGRWKPPQVILDKFYKLMALRDTASKSDYTFGTICGLFLEELGGTNPDLAKRYEQTLHHFCEFDFRGRKVSKLLVNAKLEGIHLEQWVATFPSTQTQRTYINCCKAVLTWAATRKA